MKKLLLTIITLSIIAFNGCYDPDTATVRIKLGNMPVAHTAHKSFIDKVLGIFVKEAYAQTNAENAGVRAVHIAAYSGYTLLATVSINAEDIENGGANESSIEISIPAGENITILVAGESNGNPEGWNGQPYRLAEYYGADTRSYAAGETAGISINMSDVNSLLSLAAFWAPCGNPVFSWNSVGIPVKYVIENYSGGTIYEGYEVKSVEVASITDGYFYLDFAPFNIHSSSNSATAGQGCK